MGHDTFQDPFLDIEKNVTTIQKPLKWRESDIKKNKSRRNRIAIALSLSLLLVGISWLILGSQFTGQETNKGNDKKDVVTSENGVVAADHETCSEIGAMVLAQLDGTAVDAAVAVAFCLGVVNPTSSGIGGGAFMVVADGSSPGSVTTTYDMRETAPSAASQEDTAEKIKKAKERGPLSIAVPGEVAGLYKAWQDHGRVKWKLLLEPSINLARYGFKVGVHLDFALSNNEAMIKNDIGLKSVFTKEDTKLLKKGDTCYNLKLAETLESVAEKGMETFYKGDIAKKLANDVEEAEGIMRIEDLESYKVNVTKAMVIEDVMGYKIQGMWPPSSGTTGFAMVINVLAGYKNVNGNDKNLDLHRAIEAMKYMLAARMDLGDPAFVHEVNDVVKKMISKSYADEIRGKISDEETYSSEHYLNKYRQLKDQGTSHFCVVDRHRNVVSMTTTVNYAFGSGFMSPSTGIILNNQMADFSIPTDGDSLPLAPANFIAPKKRPLSSMMPLIITKDDELVGVIGASGGIYIIPAVVQVFLNHFILKMTPLEAVKSPRVYHKLKPNKVLYEDWKVYNGDHIKLEEETLKFLKTKGHELVATDVGATVQFVVQNRQDDFTTVLTAVSDLRKGGKPAAAYATAQTPALSPSLSPIF